MKYQLLHATAGTVIEAAAQNASQAILIIHEFVPVAGKSHKAKQNDSDWHDFNRLLLATRLKQDVYTARSLCLVAERFLMTFHYISVS
ncbi:MULTISPECIES: DUF6946 family protein [Paenibacillus]|uniref:DUF6946 family protein n=1 Tax=Paenibacillus TaxID=44249 RepID=UPI00398B4460